MTVSAKYENGVFKPLEDVSLSEGAIVEVHVPPSAGPRNSQRRSVGDFAFYGIWKDRSDIADSGEYVNNLRSNIWG